MGIIGNLKDLIFGAKPEPKFSESDFLAAKQRAETLVREFNESLVIADQSKSRKIREERLQIARQWFVELKKLTIKFPFLSLPNLQAVEASIIAVEAETSLLPYNDATDTSTKNIPDTVQPERSGQDRQRLSEREEQTILMCIQGCFRVVNESIEIARKSKNLETKLSRLRVARDNLKEAQGQASQFSLEVGGFAEAEAEINRIDEAIKAGTPTEVAGMQQTDANAAYASTARNFLMEATALKKAKKYIEACDKLCEAYSADGAENLFIEERLRLPMYLQLAGKNDEGWDELNRLYASYDQSFQMQIENQMRIFLRKEKNESASNPVRVILRGDNKLMEDATVVKTARNLLKEATALKKVKRYIEACDKLREAYSADGAENLMIADRLRLPMYLQLAGKNDEAWDELNRLDARYTDQYSEAGIIGQMSTFLQKENNETALNPVRVILREKTRELDHVSIMQAARDTSRASLRSSADICPTHRWLCALDSDTCVLCGMRDGKEWDTLTLEPVGHSIPFISPPLHWNCRCRLSPVTRLLRMAEGQRASMFGPVDRKMTFGEFLKHRDTTFQDEVFGEDRAKIWRDAKLSLDQLVDGAGRELTLDELRAKYCK